MNREIIKSIDLYAMVDENASPIPWAGFQESLLYVNNIVRITTSSGLEGIGATLSYTENFYDKSVIEAMRVIVPSLIGKEALMTESIYSWLMNRSTWVGLVAKSPIDIALWDIKAKYAKLSLFTVLGGAKSKLPAYASSPFFNSNNDYISYVEDCIEEGFTIIKIHCSGYIDVDLKLVQAIQNKYGDSKVKFMLDASSAYNLDESKIMAQLLESYQWIWFEAPLPDVDINSYKKLKDSTIIEISPHGNNLLTLQELNLAIQSNCWSSLRLDATVCGGITPLNKCFALAESNGMNLEIQSMGYTLTQSANLHVALAHHNCRFIELFYPYDPFEFGSFTKIRIDSNGFVTVPHGYGLGVDMNWSQVLENSILTYHFS